MADQSEIKFLIEVPARYRSIRWLRRMLRYAIMLELSTIPPYLCAMWSIDEHKPGYIKMQLQRILLEEMRHLGLACNLLAAFHQIPGTPHSPTLPILNQPGFVPIYPGPLPGGVHPGLVVSLAKLSKSQVSMQFMQIEFPHPDAVVMYAGHEFPTIGALYREIGLYLQDHALPTSTTYQLHSPISMVNIICTTQDALDAIDSISREGEGAHGSPFVEAPGGGKELAHFYQFAEFFWQRRIQECGNGGWGFCGDKIDWPVVLDMADVPAGGYQTTDAYLFDSKYTEILDALTQVWHIGNPAIAEGEFMRARDMMIDKRPGSLSSTAIKLMKTPRIDGSAHYGPCFRLQT